MPHDQQKQNIKAVQQAWAHLQDLYDKTHPATSSKISDYTGVIAGKRGYG